MDTKQRSAAHEYLKTAIATATGRQFLPKAVIAAIREDLADGGVIRCNQATADALAEQVRRGLAQAYGI